MVFDEKTLEAQLTLLIISEAQKQLDGQSSQAGGTINSDNTGSSGGARNRSNQNNGGAGYQNNRAQLPPGHPGRVGPQQQVMSQHQTAPIEMSNIWNILHTLGATGGVTSSGP